jgi:hypothetical protein
MYRLRRCRPAPDELWGRLLTRWYHQPQPAQASWARLIGIGLLLSIPFDLITWELTTPEPTPSGSTPDTLAPSLGPHRPGRPAACSSRGARVRFSCAVDSAGAECEPAGYRGPHVQRAVHPTGRHHRPRPVAVMDLPPIKVCIHDHSRPHAAPVCRSIVLQFEDAR